MDRIVDWFKSKSLASKIVWFFVFICYFLFGLAVFVSAKADQEVKDMQETTVSSVTGESS